MLSRSRRGAVSLMAALLVGPVVLSLSSIHVVLQRKQDDIQLARAMRLQLQGSLALYDQDLYQQFGVMAVPCSQLSTDVFERLAPDRFSAATAEIDASNDALDPDSLAESIGRTMQLRLPLLWIKPLTSGIPTARTDQAGQAETVDLASSSIATAADWLDGPLAGQLDELQDQLIDRIIDGLREAVEPVVKETLSEWLDRLDEVGELRTTLSNDSISLISLQDLLALLDTLSDSPDSSLLRQAQLAEYGVRFLTRDVTVCEVNGQVQPLQTLAGLSLEKLAGNRPAELERIITGQENVHWAKLLVRSGLATLRSLVHLADLLQDPERRQHFEALAVAGVLAISAASGGSVNLDPQLLARLLLVGEAIRLGGQDVSQLLAGQRVSFIPGSSSRWNLSLAYHDFLRLMLLVIPQETLLSRIEQVIRKAKPEPYTGCVTLRIKQFQPNRQFSLTAAYDH